MVVWLRVDRAGERGVRTGPDSAVVRGVRGQVGDRGDAVVPARVVAVEGRRRAARRRARLRRPGNGVLVPGGEVRRRRRDHRSGVVDGGCHAVGELAVDVPRVLVPAAGSPRAARIAAVAADVGLDASTYVRRRADGRVVRDVDVAPDDHRRLGEVHVRAQTEVAGDVHPRGPVDVVVQRLIAGAARVPGIEVVPDRVVQRLRQARRDGDRRLQRFRDVGGRLVRVPDLAHRGHVPERLRADQRAAVVDGAAVECRVQPGRGGRPGGGRVRVLGVVAGALRQRVRVERVVRRQVEDRHAVVDPGLGERERALARVRLARLGRGRSGVGNGGRARDSEYGRDADGHHERHPALAFQASRQAKSEPHDQTIGAPAVRRPPSNEWRDATSASCCAARGRPSARTGRPSWRA